MRFNSILRASLAVVVIIASVVCNPIADNQYVNSTDNQYVNSTTIFGSCAKFCIQGGTGVSFNGVVTNIHTGSVGVAPGTSITGTPQLGAGYAIEDNSAAAINCAADEGTAYANLKGVTCTNLLPGTDLSGITLFAGVYCTTAGYLTLITGALTLDAQGDSDAQFIFQTATTFITSENTNIILLNGTLAENIFWQVGSSATLGGGSTFIGQILAYASISVEGTVTIIGRLFAQAAVTFAGNDQVTLSSQ